MSTIKHASGRKHERAAKLYRGDSPEWLRLHSLRADVMGCGIDRVDLEQALTVCEEAITSRIFVQHMAINVAKLIALREDDRLRESIERCELVTADGQPIVWASRLLRDPLPSRVAGIDLMDGLLQRAAVKGYRVYILGGKREVLERAIDRIAAQHPAIAIVGYRDGYYSDGEEEAVAADIAAKRPDILFVAMSSPRKEYFLAQYGRAVGVPFVMGVGGAIDILGGVTRRAPEILQRLSLEWLFRLVQEPRRLAKRYFITNTRFLLFLAPELVKLIVSSHSSSSPSYCADVGDAPRLHAAAVATKGAACNTSTDIDGVPSRAVTAGAYPTNTDTLPAPTPTASRKMSTPTFSVIVPAFNAGRTVRASIASVLAQTRPDFEIIVVDDGSTDQTADAVQRVADPRVVLLSQPNRGLAAARNAAIDRSRGRYVAFLDSDDLWLPDYLECAFAAISSVTRAGFAYTDAYAFDSSCGRIGRRGMDGGSPPAPPPPNRQEFLLELVKRNFVFVSTTVPRAVLDAVGGFDARANPAEDYGLWLRIAASGYSAVWMPGKHALYRVHAGQMSSDARRLREGELVALETIDIDQLPTERHRAVLASRRQALEREIQWINGDRSYTTLPRRVRSWVGRVRRSAGYDPYRWRDSPPADVAEAFPDLRIL